MIRACVVEFEHAKVDLDVASLRRNRQSGAAARGESSTRLWKFRSVSRSPFITRNVSSRPVDQRERAGRAGGLVFDHVAQIQPAEQPLPVMEVRLHQLRQMTERERHVADPVAKQAAGSAPPRPGYPRAAPAASESSR